MDKRKVFIQRYFLGKTPAISRYFWLKRKKKIIQQKKIIYRKKFLFNQFNKINVLLLKQKSFYSIMFFFGNKFFYQKVINIDLFRNGFPKLYIFLFLIWELECLGLLRNCKNWN